MYTSTKYMCKSLELCSEKSELPQTCFKKTHTTHCESVNYHWLAHEAPSGTAQHSSHYKVQNGEQKN